MLFLDKGVRIRARAESGEDPVRGQRAHSGVWRW